RLAESVSLHHRRSRQGPAAAHGAAVRASGEGDWRIRRAKRFAGMFGPPRHHLLEVFLCASRICRKLPSKRFCVLGSKAFNLVRSRFSPSSKSGFSFLEVEVS